MTEDNVTEDAVVQDDDASSTAYDGMIDRANRAAERMEKANKDLAKLLLRQEVMMAEKRLGGISEAGQEKPKEESPKEYKDRIMRGVLHEQER